VRSFGDLLGVVVWGVVVICYGLLFGEWWVAFGDNWLWVIVWGVVVIYCGLMCEECW